MCNWFLNTVQSYENFKNFSKKVLLIRTSGTFAGYQNDPMTVLYVGRWLQCSAIHYVILALPSSLFLMQLQKNHQKMYRKRKGKQTFFCKQTRLAIKNHQFFKPNAHSLYYL
jgi:hypothetical protein